MKIQGIIVNSNVYKDNDLILDLLTKDQIITFRSKGIKKNDSKNKSLCFDFAFIEAEFYKKGDKYTLINGKNIINTSKLYSSFEGLVFINFLKELLFKLVVDEDKYMLYEHLSSSLKRIKNCSNNVEILQNLIFLMLHIGEIAGFSPISYYENTSIITMIKDFYNFSKNINSYSNEQCLLLIKKIAFYLEETSDIKINCNQLLLHL